MKFVVTRTSNDDYMEIKDFSTIDELINFSEEVRCELIIGYNFWYNEDIEYVKSNFSNINAKEVITIPNGIEIYDGYRE